MNQQWIAANYMSGQERDISPTISKKKNTITKRAHPILT